jgi:hypothetical protein
MIYVNFNYSMSILDGYFNPLVFWYQWDYLLMQGIQDWHC